VGYDFFFFPCSSSTTQRQSQVYLLNAVRQDPWDGDELVDGWSFIGE